MKKILLILFICISCIFSCYNPSDEEIYGIFNQTLNEYTNDIRFKSPNDSINTGFADSTYIIDNGKYRMKFYISAQNKEIKEFQFNFIKYMWIYDIESNGYYRYEITDE